MLLCVSGGTSPLYGPALSRAQSFLCTVTVGKRRVAWSCQECPQDSLDFFTGELCVSHPMCGHTVGMRVQSVSAATYSAMARSGSFARCQTMLQKHGFDCFNSTLAGDEMKTRISAYTVCIPHICLLHCQQGRHFYALASINTIVHTIACSKRAERHLKTDRHCHIDRGRGAASRHWAPTVGTHDNKAGPRPGDHRPRGRPQRMNCD